MASIDYLDAFQAILSLIVIVAIGYLCGAIKMFGIKEASSIWRTIHLVAMPGLLFRQIGIHRLTLDTWKPFFVALLVQITIHLLLVIIIFAFPFEAKRLRFLQTIFSVTYINHIYFGYPLLQVIFGDDFTFVAAFSVIVQFFIQVPLHSFLVFKPPTHDHDTPDSNIENHSGEEGELEMEDGIDHGSGNPINPIAPERPNPVDAENPNQQSNGSDTARPISPSTTEHESGSNDSSPSPENQSSNVSVDVEEHESESEEQESISLPSEVEESDEGHVAKPPTKWTALLWTVVTPINICTILGIIWSATKWTMPVFLDCVVTDLEKCVMAAGLFCIGVFMWEHPVTGCNWPEVLLYLLIHYFVIPFIAMFWGWVLHLSNQMVRICTLIHVMPTSLTGYIMTINCGYGMQTASFTFFYSNVLFVLIGFLWVVLFNESKLFD